MAKTDFKTPHDYIQTLPEKVQAILNEVRQTIQKAVPEAEEVISYQIPAFKYHGWIFYVSAYKKHFSLSCPPPYTFVEAFKKELSGYTISKSTIQFPFDKGVPVSLIYKMSQYRAKENLEREAKVKKSTSKKSK
jgi:uncharacterized protein YdhG (YjbR/CyaY superfamily)